MEVRGMMLTAATAVPVPPMGTTFTSSFHCFTGVLRASLYKQEK